MLIGSPFLLIFIIALCMSKDDDSDRDCALEIYHLDTDDVIC